MKTLEDCSSYEKCEAPLCPLSKELDTCVWYPDEQVCMSTKFTKLHWVRIQKRLRKYGAKVDNGFFTKKMLEKMYAVSAHTKGIDPDSRKARQVEDMADYPKETTIPLSQSYKMPLKTLQGHSSRGSRKAKQLVFAL